MHNKINNYNFTNDYAKELENFITEINCYLSNYNKLTLDEMKDNFKIIIDNFKNLMEYCGIDENWNIRDIYFSYKLNIDLINYIKEYLTQTLITWRTNKEYRNIIFEFHRYAPFSEQITTIYKLLINATLYSTNEDGFYKQPILSLYLSHAIIYNNFDAIKILIEEHNVSPLTVWPHLPNKHKHLETKLMPLIQTIHTNPDQKIIKFFYTIKQHQEQIFLFMLSKINFNDEHIKPIQTQEIFNHTFKNYFTQAMHYLLEQKDFCNKINFKTEEFIMLAFSKLFAHQYNQFIDIILTHPNIANNHNINITNIRQQLEQHISLLNNMLTFNANCQNLDHIVLKIVLEFTKTYLTNNYAANQELLFEQQQQIETLMLQNGSLLQSNNLLHQQLLSCLDCLQRSNHAIRTLQFKASSTNTRPTNKLRAELNKTQLELQSTKQKYNNVLYSHSLFFKDNPSQTTCDVNKHTNKQDNSRLRKSNSFYL